MPGYISLKTKFYIDVVLEIIKFNPCCWNEGSQYITVGGCLPQNKYKGDSIGLKLAGVCLPVVIRTNLTSDTFSQNHCTWLYMTIYVHNMSECGVVDTIIKGLSWVYE